MKQKIAIILAVFLFLLPVTSVNAAANEQRYTKAFAQNINTICKNNNVVGMSLAVFKQGEIIYTQSYGYANKEANILSSSDTKYRVLSVSKTIAAISAYKLKEQGKLDLGKPISEYLGYDIGSPITMRHLMTHTSGLGNHSSFVLDGISLTSILKNGRALVNRQPGTQYFYNNFGGNIVGAVVEKAANLQYCDYTQKNLFEPLDIDGGFTWRSVKYPDKIAVIYSGGIRSQDTYTWSVSPKHFENLPLGENHYLTSGELVISASDLAKFGIILAGDGSYNEMHFLEKESVDDFNKPYINTEYYVQASGIRIYKNTIIPSRTIYGHPGQQYGMVAGLYYDRSDKTGVAICTNGANTAKYENDVYRINNDVTRAVYTEFFDN